MLSTFSGEIEIAEMEKILRESANDRFILILFVHNNRNCYFFDDELIGNIPSCNVNYIGVENFFFSDNKRICYNW